MKPTACRRRSMTAALIAGTLTACSDDRTGPLPATRLVISAPSSAIVGDYLNSLIVELRDANGNVVTDATNMVSIAMTAPNSFSSIWGTTTVAAAAGIATFDDISIDTPGSGFVFMATSGILVSGMSSGTDVVAEFTTAANLATTLVNRDDEYEMVPIGFTFPFYGTNYGNAYINTNGLITFEAGCLEFGNVAIPDANTECDGYIAPFWEDLDPGSAGDIYFGTSGSAPNRTFIVEWRGVAFYTDDSSTGSSALFNLILYEGSGDVEFQYGPMSSLTTGIDTGSSATIGFENQTADRGLEVSFDTENAIVPGRAMRFAYGGGNFVRVR